VAWPAGPASALPSADMLLVHKDNRDTPRVRVVLTYITEGIHAR
jgi:hypothetical protein